MFPELAERQVELEQLCRNHRVQRLDLFGSATTAANFHEESDLDFLVEFEPLAPGLYADTYFGLLEGLELLFRRPVDLVVASAIKNPYFLEAVEQSKSPLYAA